MEQFAAGRNPLPGEVQLQLISVAPPWLGDTVTVTVVAQARDDSGPVVVCVPRPLIPIDSVQLTVRFVPPWERPYVDTVGVRTVHQSPVSSHSLTVLSQGCALIADDSRSRDEPRG